MVIITIHNQLNSNRYFLKILSINLFINFITKIPVKKLI